MSSAAENRLLEAATNGLNDAVRAALSEGASLSCADGVCIEFCCVSLYGANAEFGHFEYMYIN